MIEQTVIEQAWRELDTTLDWVASDDDLLRACSGWSDIEVLVVDTEFIRRRTFYPIPALLQFYDGRVITIVDPLQINNWQPLADILLAPGLAEGLSRVW